MSLQRILVVLLIVALLSSCGPSETNSPEPSPTVIESTTTSTVAPTVTLIPTLASTPTPTLVPMDDFMKGLVYFPAGWGGDNRPETEWILKNIVLPTGANWIRIHFGCLQDGIESTEVYCNTQTEMTDQAYIHLVEMAHRQGIRVMFEHYIDSSGWSESWSGEIGRKYNEEQWAAWFTSYSKMILHYAQLAENAGTDYLIISSELESTTLREKEWRSLIAQVREVYHGKVSMAYSEESSLQSVQFWDALDAITVHPYYLDLPGVTDPTAAQLTEAFTPRANRLEALSKKWNKPILITEIGFPSVHTITKNYNIPSSNQIDLQEQTDLFQAVFNTFYGKDWVAGIFWYAFEGGSNYAEPWNPHFAYIGKPAENVIRSFYGAPPMPTPTPVLFPEAPLPATEIIYDDGLNSHWGNYPPEGDPVNIKLKQSDIAVSGNAIQVNLLTFWSLDFRNDMVDWDKYQWLDFDLYADPKDPHAYTLGVSLRDTSYYPSLFKVELLQSQFIEGGKLQPKTWQHVRIPLDVFGPQLSRYVIISIDRPAAGRTNEPLTVYVDNVILSGK
ncbi:MAG: glycosyl hydrolase [Anaerolineales bacterium]